MKQIEGFRNIKKMLGLRFLHTLITYAAVLLLSFIVHVSLARVIGATEYGIYAYAFSWLSVISIFGVLGFQVVVQRFIPDYIQKQEWMRARGVLLRSFQVPGAFSLLLACVFMLATGMFVEDDEHLRRTLLWAAFLIPFIVWLRILQGCFIALKRPLLAQLPEGIVQPLVLLAILGVVSISQDFVLTASGLMLLMLIISVAVAMMASAVFLYRVLPLEIRKVHSVIFQTPMLLGVALPAVAISSMHLIMGYTDTIMIGVLRDTTLSGIYSVSSRVAALVAIPLAVINLIVTPHISQLYHGKDVLGLQKVVSSAAKLSGLFVIPLFALLWVMGGVFLNAFGEEFVTGGLALRILMVGQLVNVLSGSVVFLMMLTGNQWRAFIILFVAAMLNIVLNMVLIPSHGIEGAAMATSISMVLWNLILVVSVYRQVGVNPTFLKFRG